MATLPEFCRKKMIRAAENRWGRPVDALFMHIEGRKWRMTFTRADPDGTIRYNLIAKFTGLDNRMVVTSTTANLVQSDGR